MIALWTNFYFDPDPIRQAEIDLCLARNIANQHLDHIYLLVEHRDLAAVSKPHAKCTPILVANRPTFNDFFSIVNSATEPEDVAIIANSDIWMDDTIALAQTITPRQCYALLRYENGRPYATPHGVLHSDSQDCWIFRGPVRGVEADFMLGCCGCDNRLCYELDQAGYDVQNPCLDIKTHHVHLALLLR